MYTLCNKIYNGDKENLNTKIGNMFDSISDGYLVKPSRKWLYVIEILVHKMLHYAVYTIQE